MAIEVYQSNYRDDDYNNFPSEAFELASFFSSSNHFTIIDSYTTHWWVNRPWETDPPDPENASYSAHRYKGDPINDTEARPSGSGGPYHVWEDTRDLAGTGCWFVVRCDTTIHGGYGLDPWEALFQWHGSTSGFSDVSGLNYGYNGGGRVFLCRFSPHGGWDQEDVNPDFNPAGQSYRSSQNRSWSFGAGGSGDDSRWFLVVDDGQLLKFNRRNENPFDSIYFSGYMGDIYPVGDQADQPVPRVYMWGGAVLNSVASNQFLPEDTLTTGPSDSYGGLGFEDKDGSWFDGGYRLPAGDVMISYLTQPNRHAAELLAQYELDILPYYLIPHSGTSKGVIGTIPLIGRAYMPGFMLLANKQILCTASGYGILTKWDGSTSLNF